MLLFLAITLGLPQNDLLNKAEIHIQLTDIQHLLGWPRNIGLSLLIFTI